MNKLLSGILTKVGFRDKATNKHTPANQPFLRWAGGKRRLAARLMDYLPPEPYGTYWEPFLGSGAMFFALGPKKARLADVNAELIQCLKL